MTKHGFHMLNLKTICAAVLVVGVGCCLYAAQSSKSTPNCRVGQPCMMKSTPSGRPGLVFNAKHDLQALNLGYEIDLSWYSLPPGTARITIYRSSAPSGPWTKLGSWSITAFVANSYPDIVDGTSREFYYRLEAVSSSGRILKIYKPLRVSPLAN